MTRGVGAVVGKVTGKFIGKNIGEVIHLIRRQQRYWAADRGPK
jgi:hypothetical protein